MSPFPRSISPNRKERKDRGRAQIQRKPNSSICARWWRKFLKSGIITHRYTVDITEDMKLWDVRPNVRNISKLDTGYYNQFQEGYSFFWNEEGGSQKYFTKKVFTSIHQHIDVRKVPQCKPAEK